MLPAEFRNGNRGPRVADDVGVRGEAIGEINEELCRGIARA
jgi:hypothetical protein